MDLPAAKEHVFKYSILALNIVVLLTLQSLRLKIEEEAKLRKKTIMDLQEQLEVNTVGRRSDKLSCTFE